MEGGRLPWALVVDGAAHAAQPGSRMLMRSAKTDLIANGLAVFARLGSGTILFVILGRLLGPESFGDFMTAMAGGTMLAFLSSLGLTQQALREVAVRRADSAAIAAELFSAKLILALAVAVVAISIGAVAGDRWWVFALLALALVCDGLVDFLFAMLKAHGHYGTEAGFSTAMALVHLIGVSAVCAISPSLLHVAMAFTASRMVQLAVAVWVCRRDMHLPPFSRNLSAVWVQVRSGWAYSADVGLSLVASQIDTLIVRFLLGAYAVGLYQAGMRVVVGMLSLSVVAGNVFIPRLTKAMGEPDQHAKVLHQLRMTYVLMAAVSAAGVWALGALLTAYGYGDAYAGLWNLWPWLAALVGVRVLAANYGVQLTALGRQAARSFVNVVALVVNIGAMLLFIHLGLGLRGVVGALLLGACTVFAIYRHQLQPRKGGQ